MNTQAGQQDEPLVLRTQADGVCRLTLNRPAVRNALSAAMIAALRAELQAISRDAAINVVVLAANGPVFCAGHDLKELQRSRDPIAARQIFTACGELMQELHRLPQPVIARVQGVATAAGCQLVASCDLALAADTARFATPGVNIGLFCSTPMVALTRAVSPKAAMEMLLTGELIDAAAAEGIGLINRAVPEAELDAAVDALATRVAGHSRLVVTLGKEGFYRQLEVPLSQAYEYASALMVRNLMADDAGEGIDAFLAKRKPTWTHR
jgi:enoyl-CoA hydratase/carnithine racemase